jgi:hypothetical protein
MHDHAGGLVDYRDVRVPMVEVQAEILRLPGRGGDIRDDHMDLQARIRPEGGLDEATLDLDVSLTDERLNPGSGEIRKERGQKLVQP